MGSRHKSFTTSAEELEPVTFEIDGETFVCASQVPGSVILQHADRLMSERTAAGELLAIWPDVMSSARALDEDGEEIEGSSELERFRAYIDHPDHRVSVQMLGEILQHVLGELSEDRPTEPPSPSRRGRPATGATSGAALPTGAST